MITGGSSNPSTSTPHSWFIDGLTGPRTEYQPSVAEPPLRPFEETVRGLLIVTTVEKAEKTDSIIVVVIVPSVLDRRHPSDGPAITLRNEERPLRLLIEGVPTLVQSIPHDRTERRNPAGQRRVGRGPSKRRPRSATYPGAPLPG